MARIQHLPTPKAIAAFLEEHPEARELAETIAHIEQQLGQEAMRLVFDYFEAEAAAESADDPALLRVLARVEERARGRLIP